MTLNGGNVALAETKSFAERSVKISAKIRDMSYQRLRETHTIVVTGLRSTISLTNYFISQGSADTHKVWWNL